MTEPNIICPNCKIEIKLREIEGHFPDKINKYGKRPSISRSMSTS